MNPMMPAPTFVLAPTGPRPREASDRVAWALTLALALGFGCHCAPELPSPISRVEVAEHDSARALVHSLAQPGASPAVCGRDPAGLRVTLSIVNRRGANLRVRSVMDGRVEPTVWRACMKLLLERADDHEHENARREAALHEEIDRLKVAIDWLRKKSEGLG